MKILIILALIVLLPVKAHAPTMQTEANFDFGVWYPIIRIGVQGKPFYWTMNEVEMGEYYYARKAYHLSR